MVAQDQDWLVSHYLPLQVLFPKPGYARIMERDPAFQLVHRLITSGFFALGGQIMAAHPIVMQFMSREAGVMILIKLMQLAGVKGEAAKKEISYSDIGDSFGTSRTHVRKILQDTEKQDLVRLTQDRGQFVEVMPELVQAFDRFVAASTSGHDLIYDLALQRVVA